MMGGQRLSRDLRYTINRMAHEHAKAVCGAPNYQAKYAEEKARLRDIAVAWLATGNSFDEVLAKLQGGPKSRDSKLRETIKALQQQLKEMR